MDLHQSPLFAGAALDFFAKTEQHAKRARTSLRGIGSGLVVLAATFLVAIFISGQLEREDQAQRAALMPLFAVPSPLYQASQYQSPQSDETAHAKPPAVLDEANEASAAH